VLIEPEIKTKLDRMTLLNGLLKAQEGAPEALCAEYRRLQSEMVPVFLRVILSLSNAGLLSVGVNIEREGDIQQYATVDGQAHDVFENGNIWIAAECEGGSLKT
jgi:hypothetical protein